MNNPRRKHPSTYFMQDRSNEEELARLQIQDQMLTASMGGVLPEQSDPTSFQRILDVGCGTGGWLIEAAKTYPTLSLLVGVDISGEVLDYARTQAKAQQVSERIEFHQMDALRMLEFPDESFDLVNQRFGFSYLRTWDWPKLLQEYRRVTRPGGVIRVTEAAFMSESSSPALNRLNHLCLQALYQAGHFFTPDKNGVTSHLVRLLHQYGLKNAQAHTCMLEYRSGTPEGHLLYEDMKHLYRIMVPFIHKWSRVPDDYQQTYQQMLSEMQQPDFAVIWPLLTAWGNKPRS
jgi:ubiquinone/menaquinone biosynthesis C-methylase UbiE